jgi:hypothetical protein
MQPGIVVGDMRLEFGAGRGAGQSFEKDRQILAFRHLEPRAHKLPLGQVKPLVKPSISGAGQEKGCQGRNISMEINSHSKRISHCHR